MLPTPKKVTLVAGAAEGNKKLTAFDKALLAAGIGNLNLIRVSSILPPSCEYVERLEIPAGSLTPAAYGAIVSDKPGDLIAAAVAIGFTATDYGTIMEYSGHCSAAEAERQVTEMVHEAFAARGLDLRDIKVVSAEIRVERTGAAVAAAVLWY